MAFSMASMQASLPSIVSCRRQRPMSLINGRCATIHTSVSPPSGLQSCPTNGATVFAMRHRKRIPKLNRPADQRKALLRSLTTEVLRHGRITTTKTKAKAARKWVDKMVQLGKDGSLHSRRQALAWVYDKTVVTNLFSNAPSRYGDRKGGYCRVITEKRVRRGDSAEMAVIELV